MIVYFCSENHLSVLLEPRCPARNATGSAVRRGAIRSLSMIDVATLTAEPVAAVPLPTNAQVALNFFVFHNVSYIHDDA
jgi:hypothetical protein